jgi:DNA-binding transcriptional ArsR family regulator
MPFPTPNDLHRAATVFKALAHPNRILLACCLAQGRAVTQHEIVEQLGWPQSTVARHLSTLRAQGLVRAERHGTQVRLALDGTVTPRLLEAVCTWVHPATGDRFSAPLPPAAEGHA